MASCVDGSRLDNRQSGLRRISREREQRDVQSKNRVSIEHVYRVTENAKKLWRQAKMIICSPDYLRRTLRKPTYDSVRYGDTNFTRARDALEREYFGKHVNIFVVKTYVCLLGRTALRCHNLVYT